MLKYAKKLAVLAVGICLLAGCGSLGEEQTDKPNPEQVQIVNPLMSVASVEEMEKYLDFSGIYK